MLAARVEVSWPLPLPRAGQGHTPGAPLVWGSSAAPGLADIHPHRLAACHGACPQRDPLGPPVPEAEKGVTVQGGITGRGAGDGDRGEEVDMGIGGGDRER